MEFNEKLQCLRKQKGLTQDELATKLYVSRTAISKWESGRGYPNIESLKAIAHFFSITVDELLSADEALTIAEENHRQNNNSLKDLTFGLLDVCMSLLLFLPLFATVADEIIREASLLTLDSIPLYLKITFVSVVSVTILTGILTLALQSSSVSVRIKYKYSISLVLGVITVLLFIVSRQPYAAAFAFCLLVIKTIILLKLK